MSRIDTATLHIMRLGAAVAASRRNKRRWRLALRLFVLAMCLLLLLWWGLRALEVEKTPLLQELLPRMGVVGQSVPPEISKEGWPQLEILEPRSGEVLTGTVLLRWRGETPAGFGGLEVRIDGRKVFNFQDPTWEKTLDTSFLPEGEHTLEIRLRDVDRRQGIARVGVRIRKPQFALLRIAERRPGDLANGQEVVMDVATNGQEFDPRADFSALDSAFDPARVHWQQRPDAAGALEVRYRISEENQRPDGNYWVTISLADQQAPQVEQSKKLVVTLANQPPLTGRRPRPVDIPCAVFRPEALPPTAAGESPFEVSGPATARVGERVALRLAWKTSPQETERRFLRVSVDGLFGYFALLGSCGADDLITVKAEQVTADPLRLAIWPDQGLPAVHQLRIAP